MDVRQLGSMALVIVVAAIIIGMGAMILSSLQDGQTADTVEYNVSGYGLTSLSTFGEWLPTIAIVIVAAIIIGIIVTYLGRAGSA